MSGQTDGLTALAFFVAAIGFMCLLGAMLAYAADLLDRNGRERNDRNRERLEDQDWS